MSMSSTRSTYMSGLQFQVRVPNVESHPAGSFHVVNEGINERDLSSNFSPGYEEEVTVTSWPI